MTTVARRRAAPAAIGLIYPALVWTIHAVSPFGLALTLLAPGLCLVMAYRLARENRYPIATRVAYLGVGAPAMYSFLGGWLPHFGDGAWVIVWGGLLLLTLVERPTTIERPGAHPDTLAFAHGISALVIVTFATFHLTNHLAGVLGGATHMAVMNALRTVYRQPAIEIVLLGSVLFQFVSGSALLLYRTGRPAAGWIEVVQNASGAYLLMFFASHISAVLRTRYLHRVNTNWKWLTADNLLTDPWSTRLVPYYFLGVLALAVHVGCGLRWALLQRGRERVANRALAAAVTIGAVIAFVIMTALVAGSMHS